MVSEAFRLKKILRFWLDKIKYYLEVVTMTQALPKLVTFKEFTEWRPEGVRYELHEGVVVEMSQPVGA
jgi:hypothetical protein